MPPPPTDCESESDLTEIASDDDDGDSSEDDEVPLSKFNKRPPLTPALSTTSALTTTTIKTINTRPSTKQATARSQDKERGVRGARLSPPNNTQRSTQWLHHQLRNEWIDVNPEYQRDVVWNELKQSNLINSLIENFYIPPIVFSVNRAQDDTPDVRVCIDGKQRLTSIQLFMDGYIAYRDSVTRKKLWYKNLQGKRGKLMSIAQKERFDAQLIMCSEYEGLSAHDEREIFQRVQMGVTLTPAERLKAINGGNADLVREMVNRIPTHFKKLLPWEKAGREFLCLARVFFIINDNKALPEEPTITRIETFLQDGGAAPKNRKLVFDVVDTFCHLLQNPSLRQPFSHGDEKISRVELVMACFLIHVHRKKLSLEKLSEAVRTMRATVRPGKDGKEDKKFQRALAEFVAKTVPTLRFTWIMDDHPAAKVVQGPVVQCSVAGPSTLSPPAAPVTKAPNPAVPSKRKRVQETGDEDCEKRSRPAKRSMIADDLDSVIIESSRPPTKTPAAKAVVGKKIRTASAVPRGKASAATTTVKRPIGTKGQSASGSSTATAAAPRVAKPAVPAQPSAPQQVGVKPPSKARPTTVAPSSATADRPVASQKPTATPHRPESTMLTPPLSSGGSASPAYHLNQGRGPPAPPSRPMSVTPSAASASAPAHRPAPLPITHNVTFAVKTERSSPAVSGVGARSTRLAAVRKAKEQIASGEKTTDPRTRLPPPLLPAFVPSVPSSSSQVDREAQLQMDVDMLDASLGLSSAQPRRRDGGEVLDGAAPIGRKNHTSPTHQPPRQIAISVDTNVHPYRGLQRSGNESKATLASQSQSSFYQTPLSSSANVGPSAAQQQQQPARSLRNSPVATSAPTPPLPPAKTSGGPLSTHPRRLSSAFPPVSASSLTQQHRGRDMPVAASASSSSGRYHPYPARADSERHREPGQGSYRGL